MPKLHSSLPPYDFLIQRLSYNSETGDLRWNPKAPSKDSARWNSRHAGAKAGSYVDGQYCIVCIDSQHYCAHRIIYKMVTGNDPEQFEIDHLNGVVNDNRWSNLRLSKREGNCQNQRIRKDNATGYKGVCWHKASGQFRARVQANKKRIELGGFDTPAEAHAAYCEAAERLHGDFARIQ